MSGTPIITNAPDEIPDKSVTDSSKDVSRRDFIVRTLSVGAGALAAGGAALLGGCAPATDDGPTGLISEGKESDGVATVNVPVGKVVSAQEFEQVPFENYLKLQASFDLPFGSLIHQMDSGMALVLKPGEENKNAREIAFMDLNNGSMVTIVKKPIGTTKSNGIYDARASRTRMIWVETDLSDNSWRVYVVPLNNTQPGEAILVDEGDLDYEPPMLAVYENKVYWTHMPMAAGKANQEDSYLRALEFDPSRPAEQARPYNVLVSHGRMITNPLVSEGVITVTPRVDTDLVYYQLTSLECSNDRAAQRIIMPPSLRVSEAICLKERFAFCIERNYAYAEGLSKFGTYYQLDDDEYLHFSRTPMSPVVMFKDCLIVKSTANIVGVDFKSKRNFVIELPERCSDFGEALIGWGVQDKVVTSSIRIAENGRDAEAVMVRVFA
jgi:hypothetical protein